MEELNWTFFLLGALTAVAIWHSFSFAMQILRTWTGATRSISGILERLKPGQYVNITVALYEIKDGEGGDDEDLGPASLTDPYQYIQN